MNNTPLGVYLHVPFCVRKCLYCDFYSAPADEATKSDYVRALCAQIRAQAPRAAGRTVDTVYLGGGTPTCLSAAQLCAILDTVRGHFTLSPDAEITVECNPVTGGAPLFAALHAAGFNRLSVGVQSLDDAELRLLGRAHNARTALDTLDAARAAGFSNISADVMLGIPAQTPHSLAETLAALTAAGVTHLSAYGLRVEEGTPFFDLRSTLRLPGDDAQADLAEMTANVLKKAGFEHYEVSNYARAGYRARHNLHYWHAEEYLGFGPAAHSYFAGVRYAAARDAVAYLAAAERGDFEGLVTERRPIAGQEARDEFTMLGMRLFEGIDEADFDHRFGTSFENAYHPAPALFAAGYLTRAGGRIAFSEKGMLVSNAILSDWLHFDEKGA